MRKILPFIFLLCVSIQASAGSMRIIKLSNTCGWPADAWAASYHVANTDGNSKITFTQSGTTAEISVPSETDQVHPALWSAGNAEEACRAHKTSKNANTVFRDCENRAQNLDGLGSYFYWHRITSSTDPVIINVNCGPGDNNFPF